MKTIRKRTILAFLITIVLLVPVCVLVGRSEIDTVTSRMVGKGDAEVADISRLIRMKHEERADSMKRILKSYDAYLGFVTEALGTMVSKDGTYTGPRRPFEDGMVVSFEDGEIILPEKMPDGWPKDIPVLTEDLLEAWSGERMSSGSGEEQYPLHVGKIAPHIYYLDLVAEEDYEGFLERKDFDELIQRTEQIYQAAILVLDPSDPEDGNSSYSLVYESGYFPEEEDPEKIGITESMLEKRPPIAKLGDNWYACSYLDNQDRIIVYAQPLGRQEKRVAAVLVITAVLIFFAAALLIAFCQYIRRYVGTVVLTQMQAERYCPRRVHWSVLARAILSAVSVCAASMLLRSVWQLHTTTLASSNDLSIVSYSYKDNFQDKQAEDLKDQEEWYLYDGKRMAALFSRYPELATDEMLKKYADHLGMDYIMLFDEEGNQTASSTDYTNMILGKGQGEDSQDFRRLLIGVPEIVHDISDDPTTGLEEKYIGISMPVAEGSSGHGAMILAIAPEKMTPSQGMVFEDQLTMYEEYGEDILVADSQSGKILYSSPDYRKEGAGIEDFGLERNSLKDNYMDFKRVNGRMSFVLTNEADPGIYYEISDNSIIYEGVLKHGLIALFYTLGLLLLLGFYLTRDYTDTAFQSLRLEAERNSDSGEGRAQKRFASYWTRLEPEGKTWIWFRVMLCLMVGMVLVLAFRDQTNRFSLASYVMYGDWMKGVNLFAVCRILIMIGMTFVIVMLLRLFLGLIGTYTGSKGATICRLILSFIQYVVVFVIVLYTFEYLGFPTSSVISVLALTTLAVSLGSKDLVTDILAGIFIVLEGQFHVGDIIEIDGYRGTVQEIGIRSTVMLGVSDNIKIISNRDIRNVVNMASRTSTYYLAIQVPAHIPLETYEAILKRELPGIRADNEMILGGPDYLGVDAMSTYFLTLLIMTQCREKDYYDVRRYVNRKVWLALEKGGIAMTPRGFSSPDGHTN